MTIADLPTLDTHFNDIESVKRACAGFRDVFQTLRREVGTVLVGQDEIVHHTLIGLFAGGHVLLEGVPGLGKTLLISTLSDTLGLTFARIQFTPDIMPADITGTSIVVEDERTGHRSFTFSPGPIFHQLVLADEINRATPKSQSALLEAMQERSVTVGGRTHELEQPFFVMATQNPIEQEGTYALPEAQLDRFFFKIAVPYATRIELNEILHRTTAEDQPPPRKVLDGKSILAAQKLARRLAVAPVVQDYAIRLVLATHPDGRHCPQSVKNMIHVGVSPRGAQALIGAAKVNALVDGRYAISFRDIRDVAHPALRHRIMRSFEAEADGISTDLIIDELLERTPTEYDRRSDDKSTSQHVHKST